MTIDVSTPTARQIILDEHRFYGDEVHPSTLGAIEAAFARDKGYDLNSATHRTTYRPKGLRRHTVTITFDEVPA